ncbi:hypothetical protein WMY93_001178 [Mugilogobius chulae]|uniref:Carbonic anhydrase n=1 Tax=Mugilogobius chulae TaxID=88201 RepID=A0AAW0Q4J0_9GOBI
MADNVNEEGEFNKSKDELDWGYEEEYNKITVGVSPGSLHLLPAATRSSEHEMQSVEWGLHFPAANGEYQSPINLNSREAQYDPSLLDVGLSPNYVVCRDCEVINDGHTVRILLKSKSGESPLTWQRLRRALGCDSGSDNAPGDWLPEASPSDHEYELHEVRFHWGKENQRGSEHTVNFKAFPMELHLIHWNSTLFNCLEDALGKKNGVLIIALFVQVGKEHLGLKAITEVYKISSTRPLLRDYWVYEGSLTTPPCSENVTWILYRYPLTISQIQIEEFRRLRSHVKGAELLEGNDGLLGDNFRPTQPLSDRTVRAAFQ